VSKREQILRDAVWNAREQRQRAAVVLVELWYSWRYRHTCITN
jgi:hypothetical protein